MQDLTSELSRIIDGKRVLTRYIDRIARANDASVYRLVPRAVVQPSDIEEIRALFRFSRARKIPLTFRTAGTSLSGQAVTDGILVDVARYWRDMRIMDDGRRVRVQPGVIGGVVNQRLQPFGTKIGPDPASINACMMGGILANNSSGMCCGVAQNAYRTLDSMVCVLPDGLVVDSAAQGADEKLSREAPGLARGLLDLKRRVESDPELAERVRLKYGMKNTNGYSLNALLDYSRPVDILTHLMIGSEGTLGFIAEAVLATVPDLPVKYTGLLFFPGVPEACAAIAALRDSGAGALELMDRASLRAVQDQPGALAEIRDLPPRAAALLVEYQCRSESELENRVEDCRRAVSALTLVHEPAFTRDPGLQTALWRLRKGLIPSVGAVRPNGTSFILEDVVFPVENLAEGVTCLQELFSEHGYDDAIVFGHAKDGNLHFVLVQSFQDASDVRRYDGFMHALAHLVAGRYGGALKAEHGTGRNMAPFVEAEWGSRAYAIMKDIKRLVDPEGLLNPGVLINHDPRAHLSHLKTLPPVEPAVDRCIECGFCERLCPSRDLTLTPRQRIVVRREMARLRREEPRSPLLGELEAAYAYAGVETCAGDGMCALSCPVEIDTGELVKRLRRQARSAAAHEIAVAAADRFALLERGARLVLGLAPLLGRRGVAAAAGICLGAAWKRALLLDGGPPPPARAAMPPTARGSADAVYLPSCVTRVLGPARDTPPLPDTLVRVAARAGVAVWIPDDLPGHCCGMPFSSKGYDRAHARCVRRTLDALYDWTRRGELPVVVDTSPCAYTLERARDTLDPNGRRRFESLRILDGIEFAHDALLPRLRARRRTGPVALHPVCSAHKMDLTDKLAAVAGAFAERVEVPVDAGCCGFAGDRGFVVPELTDAATRAEAAEVTAAAFVGHYSSSRTCEIGLSRATGATYRSFWHLLDEATR